MIKINFDPVGWTNSAQPETTLQANWQAPVLMVNGNAYDLSELPDGATAKHPTLGTVNRNGDDYEVTPRLPHGPQSPSTYTDKNTQELVTTWAGEAIRFPEPIEMATDGEVPVPQMEETREPIPEEPEEGDVE